MYWENTVSTFFTIALRFVVRVRDVLPPPVFDRDALDVCPLLEFFGFRFTSLFVVLIQGVQLLVVEAIRCVLFELVPIALL